MRNQISYFDAVVIPQGYDCITRRIPEGSYRTYIISLQRIGHCHYRITGDGKPAAIFINNGTNMMDTFMEVTSVMYDKVASALTNGGVRCYKSTHTLTNAEGQLGRHTVDCLYLPFTADKMKVIVSKKVLDVDIDTDGKYTLVKRQSISGENNTHNGIANPEVHYYGKLVTNDYIKSLNKNLSEDELIQAIAESNDIIQSYDFNKSLLSDSVFPQDIDSYL